jgi:hypothetical protein
MSHGPATPAEHAARVLNECFAKYRDIDVRRTLLALLVQIFEQDRELKSLRREREVRGTANDKPNAR